MTGFIVKLIACPVAVIISDILFNQISYPNIIYPIILGIVIAIAGYIMEVTLLKRGTLWLSTAMDFLSATLIVYLGSLLFPNTTITFLGAILTAIIISVAEYVQHIWLIESGRVKKSGQRV